MRTILRILTTLLIATLAATPAAAQDTVPEPTRVTIVATPQGTFITWEAVEGDDVTKGDDVEYRVYGLLNGTWERLNVTSDTHAVVDAGYDAYGVSAFVEDQESDIAPPCVSINLHARDPLDVVEVSAACVPRDPPRGGQGL